MKKTAALFCVLVLGSLILLLTPSKHVQAAVFDNLEAYPNGYAETSYGAGTPTNERSYEFTFSSSTLQLEISSLDFILYTPNYPSNITQTLTITTDKGTWIATTTLSAANFTPSTATTTFTFPYPHPYATPGTDFNFSFSSPPTSTSYQIFIGTTTSSSDNFSYSTQHDLNSGDLDLLPRVPRMTINGSGLTLTIPPNEPNGSDFGFGGTTSTSDLGYFGNMLVSFFKWIFIPDLTNITTQLTTLKNITITRFPFSYVASTADALSSGSEQTSSTSILVSMDLSNTISTSTAFGSFMPSNTTFFSASTVRMYIPNSTWDIIRWLLATALYVETGLSIFYGVMHLVKEK